VIKAQNPGRLGELDALRGIAASIVLLFHYTTHSEAVLPDVHPIAYGVSWGGYGVHLFFAISGFVILMTLERTRHTMDFIVSRFARLFPAYWTAIIFTTIAVGLLGAGELAQPLSVVLVNLSMLQSWFYLPSVDGAYWSLAIELSFYFCMWGLWRLDLLKRIETVMLGWLALDLLWWLVPALPSRLALLLAVPYVPYFAIGMAAYRVRIGARRWRQQVPVVGLGLIIVALPGKAEVVAVYVMICAIFTALTAGRLRWLANPLLLWLGALSYPLYLIHQNFGYALIAARERQGFPPVAALAGAIAAALAVAQLVRELIEQPALKAIRNWWKARSITVPSPAVG